MMKHHQPWLCQQVSALHKSTGGVKKNLCKEFSAAAPNPSAKEWKQADGSLLSDLLLALQDELGQMSLYVSRVSLKASFNLCAFMSIANLIDVVLSEHQELVQEIDMSQHREDREDLKLELERLVARMEEKGAQITKLRKHWKMVRCGEIQSPLFYYTGFSCNTAVILLELRLLIDLKMAFTGHKYIYHLTLM